MPLEEIKLDSFSRYEVSRGTGSPRNNTTICTFNGISYTQETLFEVDKNTVFYKLEPQESGKPILLIKKMAYGYREQTKKIIMRVFSDEAVINKFINGIGAVFFECAPAPVHFLSCYVITKFPQGVRVNELNIPTLADFVKLSVEMITAMRDLHAKKISHNNICQKNIFVMVNDKGKHVFEFMNYGASKISPKDYNNDIQSLVKILLELFKEKVNQQESSVAQQYIKNYLTDLAAEKKVSLDDMLTYFQKFTLIIKEWLISELNKIKETSVSPFSIHERRWLLAYQQILQVNNYFNAGQIEAIYDFFDEVKKEGFNIAEDDKDINDKSLETIAIQLMQNFGFLKVSLELLDKKLYRAKILQFLYTQNNSFLLTIIKSKDDFSQLLELVENNRLKALFKNTIQAYQAKIVEKLKNTFSSELIDIWCHVEDILQLLENDEYKIENLRDKFPFLETYQVGNGLSLLLKENNTAKKFLAILEKIPANQRLQVLHQIEADNALKDFYQELNCVGLFIKDEDEFLNGIKLLDKNLGGKVTDFFLEKEIQQWLRQKNSVTKKESPMQMLMQELDFFSTQKELHQRILLICNKIYREMRKASTVVYYSYWGIYSQQQKVNASQMIENKIVARTITPTDFDEPALNQGDLGLIAGRLRRTF